MNSVWKRYGFAWVTAGFFIISLVGHWLFGWLAYVNEQVAHQQPLQVSEYLVQMTRGTYECCGNGCTAGRGGLH